MTTRYKFTIEYKGSDFSGWQMQPDAPSVQQTVEEAITAFSGQAVRLHVAGRTDAGVHAFGQVAHGDFEDFTKPMEPFEVAKAINALVRPARVSVLKAEIVELEKAFDANAKKAASLQKSTAVTKTATTVSKEQQDADKKATDMINGLANQN